MFIYLLFNHFVACMWIEVGKVEPDTSRNWMRRIPVPQGDGVGSRVDHSHLSTADIYIHAIYWSLVTVSTIGIGDITAITVTERGFNCLVHLVATFSYAILFGDIAALVSGLSS